MKQLVEDKELLVLKAMAQGSKPFRPIKRWEDLAALDLKEFMKLPARDRLGVGYYTRARELATEAQPMA